MGAPYNQKMEGKLKINIEVEERDCIEWILNSFASGWSKEQALLFLAIYAFGEAWKIDKFIYYNNLLEGVGNGG